MTAQRARRLLLIAFAISLLIHAIVMSGVRSPFGPFKDETQTVVSIQHVHALRVTRQPTPPPQTPPPVSPSPQPSAKSTAPPNPHPARTGTGVGAGSSKPPGGGTRRTALPSGDVKAVAHTELRDERHGGALIGNAGAAGHRSRCARRGNKRHDDRARVARCYGRRSTDGRRGEQRQHIARPGCRIDGARRTLHARDARMQANCKRLHVQSKVLGVVGRAPVLVAPVFQCFVAGTPGFSRRVKILLPEIRLSRIVRFAEFSEPPRRSTEKTGATKTCVLGGKRRACERGFKVFAAVQRLPCETITRSNGTWSSARSAGNQNGVCFLPRPDSVARMRRCR